MGRRRVPTGRWSLRSSRRSPSYLLHFAGDAGFRVVLVEPDMARAGAEWVTGYLVTGEFGDLLDDDRGRGGDRPSPARAGRGAARRAGQQGPLGGHPGQSAASGAAHPGAGRELGVPEADIARVHRPIGLNIGSRTPPEIAIATLAGLIADRNGRPGGFEF